MRVRFIPVGNGRIGGAKRATYSRGLGDNLNTLHWTVCFGHMPSTGYQVDTTYPEALSGDS